MNESFIDKNYIQDLAASSMQNIQVDLMGFVVNLLLVVFLSYIVSIFYIRYSRALSNRSAFAQNFLLIAMTTMLVISIVKSSLALSLGLVGALSIVRFRAAIKEPEELSYLFLTIAIGLGLGANQKAITILSVFIMLSVIALKGRYQRIEKIGEDTLLSVSIKEKDVDLSDIVVIVSQNADTVYLKRYDYRDEGFEILLVVNFSLLDDLEKTKNKILKIDNSAKVSYLDNKVVL
jgi:hypothetical protein